MKLNAGYPERIVCLTEEPTEILYRLGEAERIVGISAYTVRPPEAKRDKPVVSAFVGGSITKIVALRPDLVIGFSDIQAELAKQLVAANLQVLIFNQRSLQDIGNVILSLGRLVGAEARARLLIEELGGRALAAKERAARLERRPRVYFEEWDDPMISAIRWVSELIDLAGGEDVFNERSFGQHARDRFVRSEEVLERRPDLVIASWCGKPFERQALESRPGWSSIPAIAKGDVHELDASIILQPGPACLTDGLDALQRIIFDWAERTGSTAG